MATAAVAVVSMTMPALAKFDPGTPQLLQTLDEYGITIKYNPSSCDGSFMGRYVTTSIKVTKRCYNHTTIF